MSEKNLTSNPEKQKTSLKVIVILLFALVIFTIVGVAGYVIYKQNFANPFQTDAFEVQVESDSSKIHSSLETSENSDLWIPKPAQSYSSGVSSEKNDKFNYALIFDDKTKNLKIDSKTTAKTLASLSLLGNGKSSEIYNSNLDFGEVQISKDFNPDEVFYEGADYEEAYSKTLESLNSFTENSSDKEKSEADFKIENYPEKNHTYPENIKFNNTFEKTISEKDLDFNPILIESDENGLIAKNFSNAFWIVNIRNGDYEKIVYLDPYETKRIDDEKAWEKGTYNIIVAIDNIKLLEIFYENLLSSLTGQKIEIEREKFQEIYQKCTSGSEEIKKLCQEESATIKLVASEIGIENPEQTTKFIPLEKKLHTLNAYILTNLQENLDIFEMSDYFQSYYFSDPDYQYSFNFEVYEEREFASPDYNLSFKYPSTWELKDQIKSESYEVFNFRETENRTVYWNEVTLKKDNAVILFETNPISLLGWTNGDDCSNKDIFTKINEGWMRFDSVDYKDSAPGTASSEKEITPASYTYTLASLMKKDDSDFTKHDGNWVNTMTYYERGQDNFNFKTCLMANTFSSFSQLPKKPEFYKLEDYVGNGKTMAFRNFRVYFVDKKVNQSLLEEADQIVGSIDVDGLSSKKE